MDRARIEREQDKEALRRMALALEASNRALYRRMQQLHTALAEAKGEAQAELELELRVVTEQLQERNGELYGTSKSERRGRPGGKDESEDDDGDEGTDRSHRRGKKKRRQRGHGPTKQLRLPITPVPHRLGEHELDCPHGCGPMVERPEFAVKTETITVKTVLYEVQQHEQMAYGCEVCDHKDLAPKPVGFIPGGRYTEEFAAQVVVDKYGDHIPLESQVRRMERAGLTITSQTLWDQTAAMADHLWPTYLAHHDDMLGHNVLGADETTWRMLGKKRSKKWWVWGLSSPDARFYMFLPSRSQHAAGLLLKDFGGTVIADGFSVYSTLEGAASKQPGRQLPLDGSEPLPLPDFRLACCWSHARRGFFKAEKNYAVAGEALDIIAELYEIEDRAKESAADRAELLRRRAELRPTESKKVVERLHEWLCRQRPPPGTRLEKSIKYCLDRWGPLQVFLDDPDVPLDNNRTEQGMRDPVMGRRNFLGTRSSKGARAAAVFYTLVGTCKVLGIDPAAYLALATRRAIDKPGTVTLPKDYQALKAAAATA
jgi:transposase